MHICAPPTCLLATVFTRWFWFTTSTTHRLHAHCAALPRHCRPPTHTWPYLPTLAHLLHALPTAPAFPCPATTFTTCRLHFTYVRLTTVAPHPPACFASACATQTSIPELAEGCYRGGRPRATVPQAVTGGPHAASLLYLHAFTPPCQPVPLPATATHTCCLLPMCHPSFTEAFSSSLYLSLLISSILFHHVLKTLDASGSSTHSQIPSPSRLPLSCHPKDT